MVKCLPLTTSLSKFRMLGWNSTLKLYYFLFCRWTCPCWHSWPAIPNVLDGCRQGERNHPQTDCAWKIRSICLHTFRLRVSCSTLHWGYSFCSEIIKFAGPPMQLFLYFYRLSKMRNLTVCSSLWSFVVWVTSGRCKNYVTWILLLLFLIIWVSISCWSLVAVLRTLKALVPGLSNFFCFQANRYDLRAYEYWQPYSSCHATLGRHQCHLRVYLFRN